MTQKEKQIAEMWKQQREMVKERIIEDLFKLKRETKKKPRKFQVH